MKRMVWILLLTLSLKGFSQNELMCFVTSIKGSVSYTDHTSLKIGDSIPFLLIAHLETDGPAAVTFYSDKGSFRVGAKEMNASSSLGSYTRFANDMPQANTRSVPSDFRGDCGCVVPADCLSSDPAINDALLLFDTLSFPVQCNPDDDSCFYFLQYKINGNLHNTKLKEVDHTVYITRSDLPADDQSNSEGPFTVSCGVCHFVKAKRTPALVSTVKFSTLSPEDLKRFYSTLKTAMRGHSDKEIFHTFYSDIYIFFGKPDQCRLKKLVNYQD